MIKRRGAICTATVAEACEDSEERVHVPDSLGIFGAVLSCPELSPIPLRLRCATLGGAVNAGGSGGQGEKARLKWGGRLSGSVFA